MSFSDPYVFECLYVYNCVFECHYAHNCSRQMEKSYNTTYKKKATKQKEPKKNKKNLDLQSGPGLPHPYTTTPLLM